MKNTKLQQTEKLCRKCNTVKLREEFHKNKRNSHGMDDRCKACAKAYQQTPESKLRNKVRHSKRQDGYTYVYYIPEHHYVGITVDPYRRMARHRSEGKVTEGYEILARFEREVDAHWFENKLHMRGYQGSKYMRQTRTLYNN